MSIVCLKIDAYPAVIEQAIDRLEEKFGDIIWETIGKLANDQEYEDISNNKSEQDFFATYILEKFISRIKRI